MTGLSRRFAVGMMCVVVLHGAVGSPARASDSSTDITTGMQALVDDAINHASPFIVRIETVGGVQPLDQLLATEDDDNPNQFRDNPGSNFMVADGPTTGIIYSADGFILTSSFNFVRDPSIVTVALSDGRQMTADIVARDRVRKLTLLKIDAADLPTPDWVPNEQIRPGQTAIAMGMGFGGSKPMASVGIVSAVNRMMGNAIQTDAKLSPANYGGPLLDSSGYVLGICVPMAQRPGELAGIEFYDAGVGFAVPGKRVHEIVAELKEGKSFHRGWLGMTVDPKIEKGVAIKSSADPSPIRDAGALSGDWIVRINGQPIKHFGHLVKALYMVPAGERVNLQLLRGAEHIDVEVTLARSEELGPLPIEEEPFDPTKPVTEEETDSPQD
ncbi:MAG TPA: trypsin-like peptidase domain-containing protein [Phycisphaerae bacterium]|nr:trypsin-like peptidase domain-containing protein [Phycisphaerae bacterium]